MAFKTLATGGILESNPRIVGEHAENYLDTRGTLRLPIKDKDMTNDIAATLVQRGTRYGKFTGHAKVTQELKHVMHSNTGWSKLSPDQKESLEMVAHKIGRILNGDPNYDDSWVDIAGYAKLVADRLTSGSTESV